MRISINCGFASNIVRSMFFTIISVKSVVTLYFHFTLCFSQNIASNFDVIDNTLHYDHLIASTVDIFMNTQLVFCSVMHMGDVVRANVMLDAQVSDHIIVLHPYHVNLTRFTAHCHQCECK